MFIFRATCPPIEPRYERVLSRNLTYLLSSRYYNFVFFFFLFFSSFFFTETSQSESVFKIFPRDWRCLCPCKRLGSAHWRASGTGNCRGWWNLWPASLAQPEWRSLNPCYLTRSPSQPVQWSMSWSTILFRKRIKGQSYFSRAYLQRLET